MSEVSGFQGNLDNRERLAIALAWMSLFALELCCLRSLLLFLYNAGPSLGYSCLLMEGDQHSKLSNVTFSWRHDRYLSIPDMASWQTKKIFSLNSVLRTQFIGVTSRHMSKGFLQDNVWLKAEESVKSPLQNIWTQNSSVLDIPAQFEGSSVPRNCSTFLSSCGGALGDWIFLESNGHPSVSNKDNFQFRGNSYIVHANKASLVTCIFYI